MEQPEFVVDFPTLFVSLGWLEQHAVIPDGFRKGEPFLAVDWQAWCYLNDYRVKPDARFGQLATAFHWRRSQIVLPQKAGKAPYTAGRICIEAVGPALFGGWAKGGERWDCRDHGCSCGWVYEYLPGEAMGMRWPTPLIQITATSEEQTDNIYSALRPMIDKGPLAELIPKTGEEFIRLPNDGRIDTVTSSARSRLGARVTYVPQDETGIWTKAARMLDVADTQRRGVAAMGGRAEETTNGWDPSEGSVAQRTAASKRKDIFRYHPQAPAHLNYLVLEERRQIHGYVYFHCPWIDQDGIEAEAAEMIETDPAQAERFYGNRVVAGSAKAFDGEAYKLLEGLPEIFNGVLGIPAGRKIVGGFDGGVSDDHTGLVIVDIETRHRIVVGHWYRPPELDPDEDWTVPIDELNAVMAYVFDRWDVWRIYMDPPHYRSDINRWAGEYGEDRVVPWETGEKKKMAKALREYKRNQRPGVMSHGPMDDSDEAREMHAALMEHVGNAVKRMTRMRVDEPEKGEDEWLWTIGKPGAKSDEKIDLAVCDCLADLACDHAIQKGVLNEDDEDYEVHQW